MLAWTPVNGQTLGSRAGYPDLAFMGGLGIMILFLPLSESLKNIGYFLALGGWIVKRASDRDFSVRFTPLEVVLSLYLLTSLLSAAFAIDRWEGLRGAWEVFRPLSLFVMLVNDVDTCSKIRFCLWLFVLSTAVGVAWGLFDYFRNGRLRLDLHSLGYPTHTAPYLVLMLALLISLLLLMEWSVQAKIAMGALIVMTFFALFLTYSRGGWMASAACLLFLSISLKRWKLIVIGLVLTMVTLVGLQMTGRLWTRQIEMLTHLDQDDNVKERIKIWKASVLILRERPLLGIGPRNFKKLDYRQYGFKVPYRDAHNLFFQSMAEQGLLGLLSLIAVLICCACEGIRRRRVADPLGRVLWHASMGGFLTILVSGMVNTTLHTEVAIAFWSITALMLSSGKAAQFPQLGWP